MGTFHYQLTLDSYMTLLIAYLPPNYKKMLKNKPAVSFLSVEKNIQNANTLIGNIIAQSMYFISEFMKEKNEAISNSSSVSDYSTRYSKLLNWVGTLKAIEKLTKTSIFLIQMP